MKGWKQEMKGCSIGSVLKERKVVMGQPLERQRKVKFESLDG